MSDDGLRVLREVRFNWALMEEDVWEPSPFHVDGVHERAKHTIDRAIDDTGRGGGNPIGIVVEGDKGAGKTHLLGWVRERVQARSGYFFLVGLHEGGSFWDNVLLGVLDGLLRPSGAGEAQVGVFLHRLARHVEVAPGVAAAVAGDAPLTPADLDAFGAALQRREGRVGRRCQDVVRALALYASDDARASLVGDGFLHGTDDDTDPAQRALWGLRRHAKAPEAVVRDIFQLLALTGPSVVAVDQIDGLFAASMSAARDARAGLDDGTARILDGVATGLMALREATRRTVTVVACLPSSWESIKANAFASAPDRFRQELYLTTLPSPEVAVDLVARRLGAIYGEVGFTPPHPTWPVAPRAFARAVDHTPRSLLKRVDAHIQSCLASGEVHELVDLADRPVGAAGSRGARRPDEAALRVLDERFGELVRRADVQAVHDPRAEDDVVPGLLRAGLEAWVKERGAAAVHFSIDPSPGPKPALHARLRRTLDESTENEAHWAFRAIAADNAIAALARLRSARTSSGLLDGTGQRNLCLLRNGNWSAGRRTQAELEAFRQAGGQDRPVAAHDLRTFSALGAMLREGDANLVAWLMSRQPATTTELFDQVLAKATVGLPDAGAEPVTGPVAGATGRPAAAAPPPVQPATAAELPLAEPAPLADAPAPAPAPPPPAGRRPVRVPGTITLGRTVTGWHPVRVALRDLTKHTVLFAGSGSGKTVLIRRLVEECALAGVSSIVLDPNNDLARLGDPWPQPPEGWDEGDAARAEEYLAATDVVVWTPNRVGGRPLTFQPLPDFGPVLDDPDEFNQAVDAAMAALAPRAKVDGATSRALQQRAVLREALVAFARAGGQGLPAFLQMLADLPDGASEMEDGRKLAGAMAATLRAVRIIDPLFGGIGQAADPATLLTPPPGKRARVSVVNFVGLADEGTRQGFVNQLQMALFAWVKRNPSDGLGGLLVMDEAQTLAPSGAMTACTQSSLVLASQARKYGLGLVFATQAVTGLHNRIASNAATQVLGRMNAPAQITAARGLAQAKGGDAPDIARLGHGTFYVALEGRAYEKALTPMCLSHHPSAPLSTEEVLARAATGPSR